jgi:ssDNA-binding Zn-finger/Zn-ribbon topoisomerase 1
MTRVSFSKRTSGKKTEEKSPQKEKDYRDCPECGTRMESKSPTDDNGNWLWQCPKCKNCEVIWEDY